MRRTLVRRCCADVIAVALAAVRSCRRVIISDAHNWVGITHSDATSNTLLRFCALLRRRAVEDSICPGAFLLRERTTGFPQRLMEHFLPSRHIKESNPYGVFHEAGNAFSLSAA